MGTWLFRLYFDLLITRDLKPENILIGSNFVPVIADYCHSVQFSTFDEGTAGCRILWIRTACVYFQVAWLCSLGHRLTWLQNWSRNQCDALPQICGHWGALCIIWNASGTIVVYFPNFSRQAVVLCVCADHLGYHCASSTHQSPQRGRGCWHWDHHLLAASEATWVQARYRFHCIGCLPDLFTFLVIPFYQSSYPRSCESLSSAFFSSDPLDLNWVRSSLVHLKKRGGFRDIPSNCSLLD